MAPDSQGVKGVIHQSSAPTNGGAGDAAHSAFPGLVGADLGHDPVLAHGLSKDILEHVGDLHHHDEIEEQLGLLPFASGDMEHE